MTALLFTGFLAVQAPIPFAEPEKEALRHGSKALFYELELDKVATRLEQRYITDRIRRNGAVIGVVGRLVLERRISYTWRF